MKMFRQQIGIFWIVVSAALGYSSQNSGTIEGYTFTNAGNPLSDAYVFVSGVNRSDVTDVSGYFYVTDLEQGTYEIEIKHVGYKSIIFSNIAVTSNTVTNLDTLFLEAQVFNTSSVIVTASRQARLTNELSGAVNVVPIELIKRRNSATSAESLREEHGIFVQKTNHGGGSAIMRGLSSNQVLLLVDGIRLNNSTYRLGNHQYLTTVFPYMIEQIEIVRGPGSVLYGSDALGGTVNMISKQPELFSTEVNSRIKLFSRYASADAENFVRAELSLAYQRIAVQAGVSYKDVADLRRGATGGESKISNSTNGLIQSPSGFKTYATDFKLLLGLSTVQKLTFMLQHSHQSDVPRYDKYENNGYYHWNYDPQIRSLLYLKFDHTLRKGLLDKYLVTLSWHRQSEGRTIQQTSEIAPIRERDDVQTLGFIFQGTGHHAYHLFSFGTEIYTDNVLSTRSQAENVLRGRYPDDADYTSAGLFFQDDLRLSGQLRVILGARYSYISTRFKLPENVADLQRIDLSFNALTVSLGTVYHITQTIDLRLNVAQGFRAPNLSDLAKLGESKGITYEIPNQNLRPERLLSTEVGFDWRPGDLLFETTVYHSQITDVLSSAEDELNGAATVLIDSIEFQVKSKQNLGRADIWGVESQFSYRFYRNFNLSASVTYTHGQNHTLDEPVGGIPPVFGSMQIRWEPTNAYASLLIRFATNQSRLSVDDRDDPRIPEGGTPGWSVLSFRAGYLISSSLYLRAAVENIFDLNYREHGSGINGPGRNFVVSVEANL
jgi:outer membrane receptor protein involved in Fe transport